ncbi:MAG: HAD family hydrolase [Clostridia bacterium]|nr:HAD family hydrolase [Clostridia bacterium]
MEQALQAIRNKRGFICDMDGVIYHANELLPGAKNFVDWLNKEQKPFLFLTNSSERSPLELSQKLARMGLQVDPSHFYTSALATADFIRSQCPGGSVYCVGEAGLHNALYQAGLSMNDVNPDYVVIGETQNYNYQSISKAVKLVLEGAKLIGTNPDTTGPGPGGVMLPACRALTAPVELATGKSAYFLGKPNPLMMRTGMKLLGCEPEETIIVGDRMDTDIIAGIQSGTETALVLTGVTSREMLSEFPYGPTYILDRAGSIAL